MVIRGLLLSGLLMLVFGCAESPDADQSATDDATLRSEASMESQAGPPPLRGDTVTTASGLKHIEIEAGDGATPQAGQRVRVHYTGWLMDGKKFDSSVDKGTPFTFTLGQRAVIAGWDEGVALMRVGDRRRFIIPPQLGYGKRGYPGAIPADATLVFDVELLGIER